MESNAVALNPWMSIWTRPRATIQYIVNTDPRRGVLLLTATYGFFLLIDRADLSNLGDRLAWPFIALIAAIIGPFAGIAILYIGGALLRWTGNWMGGRASTQNVRAAMAWSNVPIIWSLALWIPALALFGQELFTTRTPLTDAAPWLTLAMTGFGVIQIAAGIWSIVVFLKCLGQVQGFSAWKALGNAILTVLVLVLIGGLIAAALPLLAMLAL